MKIGRRGRRDAGWSALLYRKTGGYRYRVMKI